MGTSYERWHHERSDKRLLRFVDGILTWKKRMHILNSISLMSNGACGIKKKLQKTLILAFEIIVKELLKHIFIALFFSFFRALYELAAADSISLVSQVSRQIYV